jgi:murein DD-endopeptidase MepM/ murein hydrolase activator NlpD
VTPAPVEPPPGTPRAEPTAAPTATPTAVVATPTAEEPNTERRRGSVRDRRSATPTPTPAPRAVTISPVTLGRPAPVAVPSFFIDSFRIPPFLLPIYQAAGTQYGVRWEVLAAINEIETDYGRNLDVSSAGALGWMQFMPATWEQYGVDANRDGVKDPFNPVDAIFAAARYLRAAGAERDLRRAIFAYNHAGWYVDSVLMRAQVVGGLPSDLVGSLTGLTQGYFPVRAHSTYRGEHKDGIDVYARAGAPVIAVADGRITKLGRSRVQLQDVYGNTYTYAHLERVAPSHPAPRRGASEHGAAPVKQRLFAHPRRDLEPARIRAGARVIAGAVLGRVGRAERGRAARLHFAIRPAGRGAPRIEPKPILDGWQLLESTAIYRPRSRSTLFGGDALAPSIGETLLMSKDALARQVLANRRIHIYACGRHDVEAGQVDRRVLATLLFLAGSGLEPTVSSLECGHGYLTASGNVSEHSSGNAVDIAAVNGVPILGHQGKDSITDVTVRRLLTLQGAMKPHQIISLMTFAGADNTFAMPDHDDHIHVGFRPQPGADLTAVLKPGQWIKLVERLSSIDNPTVPAMPSKYAVGAHRRRSR